MEQAVLTENGTAVAGRTDIGQDAKVNFIYFTVK